MLEVYVNIDLWSKISLFNFSAWAQIFIVFIFVVESFLIFILLVLQLWNLFSSDSHAIVGHDDDDDQKVVATNDPLACHSVQRCEEVKTFFERKIRKKKRK